MNNVSDVCCLFKNIFPPPLHLTSLSGFFCLPNISLHPPLALCPVTSCPRCEGDGYIRHVIKREMCRGTGGKPGEGGGRVGRK